MVKVTVFKMVLLLSSMLPILAVDEDADFVGYMESLKRMEMERERLDQMFQAHEEWRQNTWGGFAVRQVQAIGKHFAPFFIAVSDAMSNNRSGPTQILILILMRSLIIALIVGLFYVIGQIVSIIIGRDFIVEEQVIVEDDAPKKGDAARMNGKRRGAREKKKEK